MPAPGEARAAAAGRVTAPLPDVTGRDRAAADHVQLVLPETGVCSTTRVPACC